MKRRNFIKLSAAASALTLLPTEVFALFKSAGMSTCPDISGKKLVLVQLAGANDGLNTIVPLNQYDAYANLRPNIKLSNTGTTGVINLDSTLLLADQVGLHPSLVGFKSLYDSGLMRIIQGVGYPAQDKSHFKSTDLWFTGGDGTVANNYLKSGWVGRFLENYYSNFLTSNFPLGIQLGSSENSFAFQGEIEHDLSINMNGQDASGFYSVVSGLGGAPPNNIPNSEYGNLLKFILENDTATNIYAQTISAAFNAGKNTVTYNNNGLSNQLKSVCKFISGGLQTKVYLVKISGFDTHDKQVASNTTTHLGIHASLMLELSSAISSFITDLNNQNLGDDVITATFSEFGRKAAENGNLGTDHGEIAPMFVFGKSINPGISGTNVNLAEAVLANNYQIKTVQHDYRRVFGTLLQDWFGTSNATLDLSFYNNTTNSGFGNNKIDNILKASSVIPSSCYADTLLETQQFDANASAIIYPNPASETVTINTTQNINAITFFALDGRLVNIYRNPNVSSNFTINIQHLTDGTYILKIDTDNGYFNRKIIVRK